MTNMPIVRAPVLTRMTSQHNTATAQKNDVNSYMLPSGSRDAASPLATIDRTFATSPITVTITAARPNRSPHGVAGRAGRAPIGPMSPYFADPAPPVRVSVEVPPRPATRPAVAIEAWSAGTSPPRRAANSIA